MPIAIVVHTATDKGGSAPAARCNQGVAAATVIYASAPAARSKQGEIHATATVKNLSAPTATATGRYGGVFDARIVEPIDEAAPLGQLHVTNVSGVRYPPLINPKKPQREWVPDGSDQGQAGQFHTSTW